MEKTKELQLLETKHTKTSKEIGRLILEKLGDQEVAKTSKITFKRR